MGARYQPTLALSLLLFALVLGGCSGSSDGDSSRDAGTVGDEAVDAASEPDARDVGDVGDAAGASGSDASPETELPGQNTEACVQMRDGNREYCSESCIFDGDVHIADRADLWEFAKSGCDIIDGSLLVQDSQVNDLQGLESLRVVIGRVGIEDNAPLETTEGLESLEHFGSLHVDENQVLRAVEGLDSLAARPGTFLTDIRIRNNPSLESIEGLSAVEYATFLLILGNPSLTDLSGLRSLRSTISLSLGRNDALVNLRGLEQLERVGGTCGGSNGGGLSIHKNERLESLDGLENLNSATMGISLHGNPSLTDISALAGLTDIGKCGYTPGFRVHDNDALPDLDGFNVEDIQKVSIVDNDSLGDLDALDTLTHAFKLTIENNDRLANVDGLRNLRSVGYPSGGRPSTSVRGGLFITDNDRLADLDGLRSLGIDSGHRGDVHVRQNAALGSISGLSNAESFRLLYVVDNPQLPACDAQKVVKEIGDENIDELSISDNDDLATCP